MFSSTGITQTNVLQKEGATTEIKATVRIFFSTQNKGINLLMISFSLFFESKASYKSPCLGQHRHVRTHPDMHLRRDNEGSTICEHTRAQVAPIYHTGYANKPQIHGEQRPPTHFAIGAKFLQEKKINWWRTPAELPELNPIENLWHELIDGIHMFYVRCHLRQCLRPSSHKPCSHCM